VTEKPYWEDTPTSYNSENEEWAETETWKRYKKREASPIIDLICGMYKKTLTCLRCYKKHRENVKTTFEVFSLLMLGISFGRGSWNDVSLIDCIENEASQKELDIYCET
jgi:ubiquitin C-terminal hydrolase